MNNTLIDNYDKLKLVKTLKELISNPRCNHLQIATGYWDIPGTSLLYDVLKGFFERGGRLKLLIGKEPQLRSYQLRPREEHEEKFPDFYIKRDIDRLTEEYKPVVQMLIDYADSDHADDSPIRIHVYGQDGNQEQFLHAKCYIKPSPLGKEVEENRESEDIPEPLTPYEVYIKYLQMQFGDMVDANTSEVLKSYLPPSFNSLEYQLDAVKQCFSVMKRFGGFILGDVVGLGKTVVGVMLIRYFLENAESLGRNPKVLIVTPPAIKKAWVKTIEDFDKNNSRNNIALSVDFVTTGSIGKVFDELGEVDEDEDGDEIEDIKADNYGLVLIDESHNFRNSETQKYHAIDDLIGLITLTPYVALLSATPQNNSPQDLYNQIKLFQRDPNNSTLPNVEGGKLDCFFAEIRRRFVVARAIPQDKEEGRHLCSNKLLTHSAFHLMSKFLDLVKSC